MSTYFCVYPFKLLYRFDDIRRELVNKPTVINWFPSTFWPILGHHQGCFYCKKDVTFACTQLLCKNERFFGGAFWGFFLYLFCLYLCITLPFIEPNLKINATSYTSINNKHSFLQSGSLHAKITSLRICRNARHHQPCPWRVSLYDTYSYNCNYSRIHWWRDCDLFPVDRMIDISFRK